MYNNARIQYKPPVPRRFRGKNGIINHHVPSLCISPLHESTEKWCSVELLKVLRFNRIGERIGQGTDTWSERDWMNVHLHQSPQNTVVKFFPAILFRWREWKYQFERCRYDNRFEIFALDDQRFLHGLILQLQHEHDSSSSAICHCLKKYLQTKSSHSNYN